MLDYFGDWTSNIDALRETYKQGKPYEHVVIPNFFKEGVAKALLSQFPSVSDTSLKWYHYDNPIEQKYACNDFNKPQMYLFNTIFEYLNSDTTLQYIKQISGIDDLMIDPTLHGAGIHVYPKGGKLDIHLDYSLHPTLIKERRVNLIYYLNDVWHESWGGDLELYDSSFDMTKTTKIEPRWNTAVLFRTSDTSFHGIPKPIRCPDVVQRKSLAIYYISEPRPYVSHRMKAEFFPYPGQPVSEDLALLYSTRKARTLTPDDMVGPAWENWRTNGNGYW
jgi:Rps23 Pro-64 3,4-dihydroxylase Tpa1-like proline 4-hydroxylase